MRTIRLALVGVLLALVPALCAEAAPAGRPASWARPVKLEGVPNLHRVSATLYRSAQPTAQGMAHLKRLGVVTVVDLRSFHSDRDTIGKTGLASEHIPMSPWHPDREDAVRFLKVVTDPKRAPVLVHCQKGSDRTGAMCALYRMAVQGWKKEEALREMTEGGFGFHSVWANIPSWLRKMDIAALRRDAGIRLAE